MAKQRKTWVYCPPKPSPPPVPDNLKAEAVVEEFLKPRTTKKKLNEITVKAGLNLIASRVGQGWSGERNSKQRICSAGRLCTDKLSGAEWTHHVRFSHRSQEPVAAG
jgi:hypothetical protein